MSPVTTQNQKQQKVLINLSLLIAVSYILGMLLTIFMYLVTYNQSYALSFVSSFIGSIFAFWVNLRLSRNLNTVTMGSFVLVCSLTADIAFITYLFGSGYPVYTAFVTTSMIALYLFNRMGFIVTSGVGLTVLGSLIVAEQLGYKAPLSTNSESTFILTVTIWGLIFFVALGISIFQNLQLRNTIVLLEQKTKEAENLAHTKTRLRLEVQDFALKLKNLRMEERRNLRIDIHDYLMQDLFSLIKMLSANGSDPQIIKTLQNVLDELRNIISDLEPKNYKDFRLLVENLVLKFKERNKHIRFHLYLEGDDSALSKVPEEVKQVAFHFVRETVTNAVKHANPNNIKVNIFLNLYEDGTYLFEVVTTDDGIGLKTPNFESMGFGLFDLKWSIETRGGELSINRSELGESVLAVAFNGDLSQIEQVSYA